MQCVERTLDYMDGLVCMALLRARNIDAHLFDQNFVRQNWLEILAYGGFRIMVRGQDLHVAQGVLADYRRGALQSAEAEEDRPTCPACDAHAGEFDPRQRRWVFVAYFVNGLVLGMSAMFLDDPLIPYLVFSCAFWLVMMMTHLLRFIVNDRLQCARCHHAWRELPRTPFFQQQRQAEIALADQNA